MGKLLNNASLFECRSGRNVAGSLVVASLGVLMAVFRRFVQDDAFISFRYAKNFANGLGLVWNAGEHVEGYTNFLWTLLMAPAFKLDVDVVVWSWTLSILCFAAVLLMVCNWRGASGFTRYAAAGLIVANYSLSSYATGGLETQLVTAAVMASAWFLTANRPIFAALASAIAIMTRMDAVLLLAPFWLYSTFPLGLRKGLRGLRVRTLLAGVVFAGGPICAWLLWRHAYYGAWVPNTFLVKGGASPFRGILYVSLFFLIYGWFIPPLVAVAIPGGTISIGEFLRRSPAMAWAVALHLAYVALVGGDFMEFRMIVPCAPFVALLLMECLPRHRWLLAVLLALGPIGAPYLLPPRPVMSIPTLKGMATAWTSNAKDLNIILRDDAYNVRIALTPAGVIPFYAGLYALDELGLNSREVALRGERIPPLHKVLGNLPGHCIKATWKQIKAARINLVIDHPWVVDPPIEDVLPLNANGHVSRDMFNARHPFIHVDVPPQSNAKVVVWPISKGRWWIMVLAEPCEPITSAIVRMNARVFDFD